MRSSVLCLLALFLLLAPRALAQTPVPDDQFWSGEFGGDLGFIGTIDAIAAENGHLYVGGSFTTVGDQVVNHIAHWSGERWEPMGNGLAGQTVSAIALHSNQVYAASGSFGASDTQVSRWDGQNWHTVGDPLEGTVIDLASFNSTLLAATFSFDPDSPGVSNVQQWDGSRWRPLGNIRQNAVKLIIYQNSIYVLLGSVTGYSLQQWDGSSWSPISVPQSGMIHDVVASPSGLYVLLNDPVRFNAHLVRWNGSSWSNLPVPSDFGYRLAIDGPDVYFLYRKDLSTQDNGIYYSSHILQVKKWNGTEWEEVGNTFRDTYYMPDLFHSFTADRGRLYATTNVSSASGNTPYGFPLFRVGMWDGEDWNILYGPNGGTDGFVTAFAPSDAGLYVGGSFQYAGGTYAPGLALWTGSQWRTIPTDGEWQVSDLAVEGSDLYVAGKFRTPQGYWKPRLARWSGSTWETLTDDAALQNSDPGSILAVAVNGPQVYVGGTFHSIERVEAAFVARWDGTSWSAVEPGLRFFTMTV